MDASVIRSMTRWPDVPEVFGWLSLDRRGTWRLHGIPFKHPNSIAFLNRNYLPDERGRWFFQNGPQRVFVKLDYTPIIWFLDDARDRLRDHTGQTADLLRGVWLDEQGNCLLQANRPVERPQTTKRPAQDDPIGLLVDADLAALSTRFRGPQGQIISDASLSTAIEAVCDGAPGKLSLLWRNQHLTIKPIQSEAVPAQFQFVQDPQPDSPEACKPSDTGTTD